MHLFLETERLILRRFTMADVENLASRRVMEKAGLNLVRTFRFTPEELAAEDTYDGSEQVLWEGNDVEYALDKADWVRQEAAELA